VADSHHLPPGSLGYQISQDFTSWNLEPNFETLLITGGSGLIGRWALGALDSLNAHRTTRTHVFVVTRNPRNARLALSSYRSLDFHFVSADRIERTIRRQKPKHIWHFAAETGSTAGARPLDPIHADSALAYEICRTLEDQPYNPNVLYTSSGAVYGRPSAPMNALPLQNSMNDEFNFHSLLYGHGKILAEVMFATLAKSTFAKVSIARLFAFIGPLMPLTSHFVMGNMLKAAVERRPIVLKSDGSAVRSWMYLGDLARILLLLAAYPTSNLIDVGSHEAHTVLEAAALVAELAQVAVQVGNEPNPTGTSMSYLPDLSGLQSLGSDLRLFSLREAVAMTYEWLLAEGGGFEPPRSLHP
jgi:nucleoside-diphosphate-sugar epimerase